MTTPQTTPELQKLIEQAIEKATGNHRVLDSYDYEDVFAACEAALAARVTAAPLEGVSGMSHQRPAPHAASPMVPSKRTTYTFEYGTSTAPTPMCPYCGKFPKEQTHPCPAYADKNTTAAAPPTVVNGGATGDAETYLRKRYGAYRGHFAWRELEEAFNAGAASPLPGRGMVPMTDKQQHDLFVGQAIERVARELPEGWELTINLERGAGWVEWTNDQGETKGQDADGEPFHQQINSAIDAAIKDSQHGDD